MSTSASTVSSRHHLASWEQTHEGTEWKIVRSLTDEEYHSLNDDFSSLGLLDTSLVFDATMENFQHWHGLMTLLDGKRRRPYADRTGPSDIDLMRRLLVSLTNAVTGARTYLATREADLQRRYGKESPQVRKFVHTTRREYDQYFGYRLGYALRNFLAHLPPLEAFSLSGTSNATGGTTLRLVADAHTLAGTKRFSALVTKELRRREPEIDLEVAMSEYVQSLIRVEETALTVYLETLDAPLQRVKELIESASPADPHTPYALLMFDYSAPTSFGFSPSFSLASLGTIAEQRSRPVRLRTKELFAPLALRNLTSPDALDLVEAHLAGSDRMARQSLERCLTGPEVAANGLQTLATTTAVGLMQVERLTGSPVFEQLAYYREGISSVSDAPEAAD